MGSKDKQPKEAKKPGLSTKEKKLKKLEKAAAKGK